jgi:predicted transposase YbfD/YdcC
VSDLAWLDREIRQHCPNLVGVGMVKRRREINGKTSTERALYIGSKSIANADTVANAERSHWGVENRLHWVLDVTFREDNCRVRKGHAPQNLSALREFALSLLRQDKQYPRRSFLDREPSINKKVDNGLPCDQGDHQCARRSQNGGGSHKIHDAPVGDVVSLVVISHREVDGKVRGSSAEWKLREAKNLTTKSSQWCVSTKAPSN